MTDYKFAFLFLTTLATGKITQITCTDYWRNVSHRNKTEILKGKRSSRPLEST